MALKHTKMTKETRTAQCIVDVSVVCCDSPLGATVLTCFTRCPLTAFYEGCGRNSAACCKQHSSSWLLRYIDYCHSSVLYFLSHCLYTCKQIRPLLASFK